MNVDGPGPDADSGSLSRQRLIIVLLLLVTLGAAAIVVVSGRRESATTGCQARRLPTVNATPRASTLDTLWWDEAVILRVDAVGDCRREDSDYGGIDEVLEVTVLRRVGGTADRGLGPRTVAQFALGSMGDRWPLRELVKGDEVLALIGPTDPTTHRRTPYPYLSMGFEVADGVATPNDTWFSSLRGTPSTEAGPFGFTVPAAELEATIVAMGHGINTGVDITGRQAPPTTP